MLALVPRVQSPDRDRPCLTSRTPSASMSARQRDGYRERERERERVKAPSNHQSQPIPQPPARQQARFSAPPLRARSPTLQPHDEPVHIFANASSQSGAPSISTASDSETACLDIHNYPSADLLKLLARLLQDIAASNDGLRPASLAAYERPASSHIASHPQAWQKLTSAAQESLSTPTSSLTFHARHIPSITLEAYLLRILKYCPTTNEVFLSLLVYFDRISKLSRETTGKDFIIDSYNVHRLVIAGVTVASKFFSDVFYTNSRYAKVGGLPQLELNQLELQFLLLNDFNLVVPASEMQRYAKRVISYPNSSSSPSSPFVLSTEIPSDGHAVTSSVGVIPNGTAVHQGEPSESETGDTEAEDTEDETIRPSYSSGPSETSSLATAQSDAEEEEDARLGLDADSHSHPSF